jgi:SAM-dependent methyltransferase
MSKRAIGAHYEPRIASGRANYVVLDWASPASQEARFQVLADGVDLRGKSVLDVGAGLGDLWAFLRRRNVPVQYTGVDILEKMVLEARRQHPQARFEHADVFKDNPFSQPFDVVFCSGTFNLNLGNNRRFLPKALKRLFELAGQVVVFNLLHQRARTRDRLYAYYDPDEVLDMLKEFPCTVRLRDDYLPNDFTVICHLTAPGARGQGAATARQR